MTVILLHNCSLCGYEDVLNISNMIISETIIQILTAHEGDG